MEEKAKWWQSLSHLNTIIPLTSIPLKHVGCHRTLWKHLKAFKSFAPKIPYEFLSLSLSLFVRSISEVLNFHRFWHMTSISGSIQKTTNASPGTHPMANRKSQMRYALVFFVKRNQPGWSSTRGFWQKDPVVIFFKRNVWKGSSKFEDLQQIHSENAWFQRAVKNLVKLSKSQYDWEEKNNNSHTGFLPLTWVVNRNYEIGDVCSPSKRTNIYCSSCVFQPFWAWKHLRRQVFQQWEESSLGAPTRICHGMRQAVSRMNS